MADPSGWHNPSVLAFAEGGDPLERASEAARLLLEASAAQGMAVPPVDPLALAKLLGLGLTPHDDVADARIAEDSRESAARRHDAAPLQDLVPSEAPLLIAYNPNRPKGRLRFSIAHEIAHALFPDVATTTRHRTSTGAIADISDNDQWELELLCNVIAAELLLPGEAVDGLLDIDTDIDFIMETRRRWDVSTEALLRRLVAASHRRRTLVATARVGTRDPARIRVEYTVQPAMPQLGESAAEPEPSLPRGIVLDPPNPFATCTAVGQTVRGTISDGHANWSAQTVGIPGYPGQLFPRVLGVVEPRSDQTNPQIRHVRSDLLDLDAGTDPIIVAHVVNDSARTWGRRGVAAALAIRYPQVARAYRAWTIASLDNLHLGNIHAIEQHDAGRPVTIVSMIAQQGYGPGAATRLRYDALRTALTAVADLAQRTGSTVHVPRIGAGQAGGRWDLIENDLATLLADQGITVVVHTLPSDHRRGGGTT